ncbi:MAG: hypothetical protein R3185_06140, partial [Candidatus Thermoplasmatota archaeon]|nr:hypothetical protein [Candidatus Thermoplasmatota archaeon]
SPRRSHGMHARRICLALLLGAMVTLAGCADTGESGPFAQETGDQVLDPDTAVSFQLPGERGFELAYQVSVSEGPSIDVMVLTGQEFQRYDSNQDFTYIAGCSTLATDQAQLTCGLPAGTYFLVLDNTHAGEASPPPGGAAAQVAYQYTATYIS